jgi:hypothetical protein
MQFSSKPLRVDAEQVVAARLKCGLDSALTTSPVAGRGPGGPVSLSSPEAGRRTHRAFHRALIGLHYKDERLPIRDGHIPQREVRGWRSCFGCVAEGRSREPELRWPFRILHALAGLVFKH